MNRPNFIIIYADDLGFGDLGCYGASGIPTPNLDRMASRGVRFTNAYATSAVCTPSRYSLLTGSYPWRNPGAKILAGDAPMLIGADERTLPGTLKEAGYRTAVIGKWHLGLGRGEIAWNADIEPCPLDVGFDVSYVMAATNDRVPCVYLDGRKVVGLDPGDPIEVQYGGSNPFPDVPTARENPELLRMVHSDDHHDGAIVNGVGRIGFCRGGKSAEWTDETMAEVFLRQAGQFISDNAETPFFLYYAPHQPHVPRLPGPRFAGSTKLGPRGDVIAELDWCVGEILKQLDDLGISGNTLVLFSSDNGPVLDDGYRDEAVEKCGGHRPAGPLRGGKYSLFDGGARVPMLALWDGVIAPGESAALISHVDFLASFSALAGVTIPAKELRDSTDQSPALTGRDAAGRDHLVTEGIGAKPVLRERNWVYIPPYEGPAVVRGKGIETGNSREPQLYDLSADIGQRENLAEQAPEKVAALEGLLGEIRSGAR